MAKYKRWYDHDPLLLEVIELLRNYPDELKAQAEVFLEKIEKQVGKDAVDRFYEKVKPMIKGNRWYDNDPILSKTIELLRVVPAEIQQKSAQNFLNALKETGISLDTVN
ncbi:MAG: hypothetical protein PHV68_01000 [Candidatus Gastranaerophilales bacterium]|nr:hypothetical protein [Candidatus Gastranaerophilales bacterium]